LDVAADDDGLAGLALGVEIGREMDGKTFVAGGIAQVGVVEAIVVFVGFFFKDAAQIEGRSLWVDLDGVGDAAEEDGWGVERRCIGRIGKAGGC
jgi:hypothetical protein